MTVHPADVGPSRAALMRDLARRDHFHFVWQAFAELHPGEGNSFVPAWHVRAICHALQRVADGQCGGSSSPCRRGA